MTNFCLALPYLPGGLELGRKIAVWNVEIVRNIMNFIKIAMFGFNEVHQQVGAPDFSK